MMHQPIHLQDIELSFPQKTCFEGFSYQLMPGSRIAIIGRNGSGKSSLLKLLAGIVKPTSGSIRIEQGLSLGYVPQLIDHYHDKSGAEKFQAALSAALSHNPGLLLLDEPTNHLDVQSRNSLMKMMEHFRGTVVAVTHDSELLQRCFTTLWHVDQQTIHIFHGKYQDYQRQMQLQRQSLISEIAKLTQQTKQMHEKLMQEQQRSAASRKKGEKSIKQRKWPTITSQAKARRGEETTGRKQVAITARKDELQTALAKLRLPEVIVPTFALTTEQIDKRLMVQIFEGSVGYAADKPLLANLSLSLVGNQRLAILGPNGSGKSTLIKGLLNDAAVIKTGDWTIVDMQEIGYLDQHYQNLSATCTVLETISTQAPHWTELQVRRHLASFLFREQAAIQAYVHQLSGGEKVRLSLAQLACKTPSLLILDELTNNLDIETREHVVQVLKHFPGALLIVSHDHDFLQAIGIDNYVSLEAFCVA